jgi:hypothetical protein
METPSTSRFVHTLRTVGFTLVPMLAALGSTAQETRTVRTSAQPRPGALVEEYEMPVHAVPVDPPLVAASEARLRGDDLVLGIVHGGEAVAFPIAYVARHEVLNSRVGALGVAPTW